MQPFEHINLSDFRYFLPESRIALFPAPVRDQSRLLVHHRDGHLSDDIFHNLPEYLPSGTRLFFNNSRVIPARLLFHKDTGSKIEIFCLKPVEPSDYSVSLASANTCKWECMIGNIRKFRSGILKMKAGDHETVLNAEKISSEGNIAIVRFSWHNERLTFADILQAAGQTPLPPYIKRSPVKEDRERYQTVYSSQEGSVAAPTAGLHFTPEILNQLKGKNILCHEVTLHVGAGTFQPIKTEYIGDHTMHAEFYEISECLLDDIIKNPLAVACVGTTTVRTLESLYWTGVKLMTVEKDADILELNQWDAYKLPKNIPVSDAFEALKNWMTRKRTARVFASTKLMIVPGYRFMMVDKLITNFHQPGSSLLLLIAAFIGSKWKETYQYALDKGFRFLSYGDSSLLFLPDSHSGQQ